jgi:hypothetical protein
MPAKDLRVHIKRNKNDAADAEAICEAADDAVRHDQERRAAEPIDTASGTRSTDAPAHATNQRIAVTYG